MDKLNAILNYIFNLFKKIKITMIVGVVLLFCSTLLFVPDDILDIFGLLPIIEKYEGGIGVGFITSISYFVCCLIGFIVGKLKPKISKIFITHKILKYLRNESSKEERTLLYENFYDSSEAKFCLTAMLPFNDGHKAPLEFKKVIYMASNYSIGGNIYFPFNLQPFVLTYLNKGLKNKKVLIENNTIVFK